MRLRTLLKFLLPHGIVQYARNRKILCSIGKPLRLSEIWGGNWLVHEAEQTSLNLLAPGHADMLATVVDVGANIGQWSTMLLDLITPEKLIVVEPQPAAFARLQAEFRANPRVQLHNVALGESEGMVQLNITRDTTGASVLQPRDQMREVIGSNWTVESKVDVPMTTLDSLLVDVPEVSLLKIDVQGYEKAVLAGAQRTLTKTKFLLIELNYMPQYEGGSWLGEIHELLTREHGFFLANASRPLVLNGRASMCDGLYVNPQIVRDWVKPDFV